MDRYHQVTVLTRRHARGDVDVEDFIRGKLQDLEVKTGRLLSQKDMSRLGRMYLKWGIYESSKLKQHRLGVLQNWSPPNLAGPGVNSFWGSLLPYLTPNECLLLLCILMGYTREEFVERFGISIGVYDARRKSVIRKGRRLKRGRSMVDVRPLWENCFGHFTQIISLRSSCPRSIDGAILVRDQCVTASAATGTPTGQDTCFSVGCDVVDGKCSRANSACANLVALCAKNNIPTEGATVYSVKEPSRRDLHLLVTAGISTVHFHFAPGRCPPPMRECCGVAIHYSKLK